MCAEKQLAVGGDQVGFAESRLLPEALAGGGVEARQMRHGAGTADVVEAIQLAVEQDWRLPFGAQHALRPLRLPDFLDVELVAARFRASRSTLP